MIEHLDADGYLPYSELLNWRRMVSLHVNESVVKEAAHYSNNFEVNAQNTAVRKKPRNINSNFTMFGLDQEGIRQLSVEKFKEFLDAK